MAKNYSLKEAVEIIVAGEDLESIMDLGRRYPVLSVKIAELGALAGDKLVNFMNYMPEHVTANKVNTAIKNDITESGDEDSDDETTEEAPKKTAKPAKKVEKEEADESDYDSMTGNQLVELCKERGLWKGLKDKKKGGMIAALKAYDENGDTDTEEEVEETEEATGKYDGKGAMELFKECKARGIKAAPKKPAKFYVDLLEKADAEEDTEAEDDGWEDEEEEPKKPAKKAPVKAAPKAKAAKKEEAEDSDDEDEWDI